MRAQDAEPGRYYLLLEHGYSDWSLWQRSDDNTTNIMVVDWFGRLDPVPHEEAVSDWPQDADLYARYPVRPENVDAIIMAARHLATPEAWYAFAKRQSGRKAA